MNFFRARTECDILKQKKSEVVYGKHSVADHVEI